MKKLLLPVLLILTIHLSAQPGKKTDNNKIPNQKEIDDMMKEAQRVMDSLGIKTPGNLPAKELVNTSDLDELVVPPKNTKLIATTPVKIFSTTELAEYVR